MDNAIQQIRNSIFELKDHVGPQGTFTTTTSSDGTGTVLPWVVAPLR